MRKRSSRVLARKVVEVGSDHCILPTAAKSSGRRRLPLDALTTMNEFIKEIIERSAE